MKKYIITNINWGCIVLLASVFLLSQCKDYLNVVPDGVATMDNAFSNRANAERFYASCYNFIPVSSSCWNYPGTVCADDFWFDHDRASLPVAEGPRIAQGQQNSNDPYHNYWDGSIRNDGHRNMWVGIRNCNIFLENIDQVPDMQEWEKTRWKAEIKFLKAYFHFFMMQLYGPIPIIDTNVDITASSSETKVFREPVDDVVEYIVRTLDEAAVDLPISLEDLNEAGVATQAIVAAVKAKVLVWAASPLFNGSASFYQNFKDSRGIQLISNDNSEAAKLARWQRAANAVKEAIDICLLAGHGPYTYPGREVMSDKVKQKFDLRGVSCERVDDNPELIFFNNWPNGTLTNFLTPKFYDTYGGTAELSATLKMAETYYTKNGLPIDEDFEWDYDNRLGYQTNNSTVDYEEVGPRNAWHDEYIVNGGVTANLNYYREPRFYAHLSFDRALYEFSAVPAGLPIYNLNSEFHGKVYSDSHIVTGYFVKKLVNFRIPRPSGNNQGGTAASPGAYTYPHPIIRLSDLYLLYAETLNELQEVPTQMVYDYVDSIRIRSGLKGVVETWTSPASKNPDKPFSRATMREIIKRERLIELAFEGHRTFDLRRWLDAEKYFNEPVRGWYYLGTTTSEYYTETVYFDNRRFTYKEYLMPLRNSNLDVNNNLVQNPGW